jgi:hypothetical protein
MADLPQVLATYDALVGVALGAGLTYAFGALNRLHQEAREDKTRWYQARLDAYRLPLCCKRAARSAERGAACRKRRLEAALASSQRLIKQPPSQLGCPLAGGRQADPH